MQVFSDAMARYVIELRPAEVPRGLGDAGYDSGIADPDQLEEDHLDQLVGGATWHSTATPRAWRAWRVYGCSDHLGPDPIVLEQTRVIDSDGVTHLDHRVVRE